jgi:hypothetical protein
MFYLHSTGDWKSVNTPKPTAWGRDPRATTPTQQTTLPPSEKSVDVKPSQRVNLESVGTPTASVPDPGTDAKTGTKQTDLGIPTKQSPFSSFDYSAARKNSAARMATLEALMPGNGRLSACGNQVAPGALGQVLTHNDLSGVSHYQGLMRCNYRWCPVCASRYAHDRGAEVQEAIDRHRAAGGDVLMATFTMRHNLGEALADVLADLCAALTRTRRGTAWKRIKATYGLVSEITALEVTFGRNGWNPHKHVALFLKRKLTDAELAHLEADLCARWRKVAGKLGRFVSTEHGVKLSRGSATGAYLVKWGASQELTSVGKESEGRTPNDLLDSYAAGDAQAGALFLEYVEAIRGRARLLWSKGLRADLEMEHWKPTPELGNRDVLILTRRQSAKLANLGLDLLDVSEKTDGSAVACWAYLKYIVGIDYDPRESAALLALHVGRKARAATKGAVVRDIAAKGRRGALTALGERL